MDLMPHDLYVIQPQNLNDTFSISLFQILKEQAADHMLFFLSYLHLPAYDIKKEYQYYSPLF